MNKIYQRYQIYIKIYIQYVRYVQCITVLKVIDNLYLFEIFISTWISLILNKLTQANPWQGKYHFVNFVYLDK